MVKRHHDRGCVGYQDRLIVNQLYDFISRLHAFIAHLLNPSHNGNVVLEEYGLSVIDLVFCDDHTRRVPIPLLAHDGLKELNSTLFEIIEVGRVVHDARSINVYESNFRFVKVCFWQLDIYHAPKVSGSYLWGMIVTPRAYKIIWTALIVISAVRFGLETTSVTHFSALIASALPLVGALASEKKKLDQDFLTILMITVSAVAAAIALAQWKVIGKGSPLNVTVPLIAGIAWLLHQKHRVSS